MPFDFQAHFYYGVNETILNRVIIKSINQLIIINNKKNNYSEPISIFLKTKTKFFTSVYI